MPKLNDMNQHSFGSNYAYTSPTVDRLGASHYTLCCTVVDESASVSAFVQDLVNALTATNNGLLKSPQGDNILSRVCAFSTVYQNGIREIHGFTPPLDIDPNDYNSLNPSGGTPLFDAAYTSLGISLDYAKKLKADDYLVNGIVFVITDGENNASTATMKMIKDEQERIRTFEELESLISILIGINVSNPSIKSKLEEFAKEAGFTHYIDAGDATPGKLAKLAAFISQSIDSQSKAIGTGGPSQLIQTTI